MKHGNIFLNQVESTRIQLNLRNKKNNQKLSQYKYYKLNFLPPTLKHLQINLKNHVCQILTYTRICQYKFSVKHLFKLQKLL